MAATREHYAGPRGSISAFPPKLHGEGAIPCCKGDLSSLYVYRVCFRPRSVAEFHGSIARDGRIGRGREAAGAEMQRRRRTRKQNGGAQAKEGRPERTITLEEAMGGVREEDMKDCDEDSKEDVDQEEGEMLDNPLRFARTILSSPQHLAGAADQPGFALATHSPLPSITPMPLWEGRAEVFLLPISSEEMQDACFRSFLNGAGVQSGGNHYSPSPSRPQRVSAEQAMDAADRLATEVYSIFSRCEMGPYLRAVEQKEKWEADYRKECPIFHVFFTGDLQQRLEECLDRLQRSRAVHLQHESDTSLNGDVKETSSAASSPSLTAVPLHPLMVDQSLISSVVFNTSCKCLVRVDAVMERQHFSFKENGEMDYDEVMAEHELNDMADTTQMLHEIKRPILVNRDLHWDADARQVRYLQNFTAVEAAVQLPLSSDEWESLLVVPFLLFHIRGVVVGRRQIDETWPPQFREGASSDYAAYLVNQAMMGKKLENQLRARAGACSAAAVRIRSADSIAQFGLHTSKFDRRDSNCLLKPFLPYSTLRLIGGGALYHILSHTLYAQWPSKNEAELSALRQALMNHESIREFSRVLQMDEYCAATREGATDDIYVVNCFNALLGAVYIIFGEGMDGSCAVGRFFAACAFHPLQLEEDEPASDSERLQRKWAEAYERDLVEETILSLNTLPPLETNELAELQAQLGMRFHCLQLLVSAITHPSMAKYLLRRASPSMHSSPSIPPSSTSSSTKATVASDTRTATPSSSSSSSHFLSSPGSYGGADANQRVTAVRQFHYQRAEWLGDAVLLLEVTRYLLSQYRRVCPPFNADDAEARRKQLFEYDSALEMGQLRSVLLTNDILGKTADHVLHLSDRIKMRENGYEIRAQVKVLADVFEAIIGVMSIDRNGGLDKVREFMERSFYKVANSDGVNQKMCDWRKLMEGRWEQMQRFMSGNRKRSGASRKRRRTASSSLNSFI